MLSRPTAALVCSCLSTCGPWRSRASPGLPLGRSWPLLGRPVLLGPPLGLLAALGPLLGPLEASFLGGSWQPKPIFHRTLQKTLCFIMKNIFGPPGSLLGASWAPGGPWSPSGLWGGSGVALGWLLGHLGWLLGGPGPGLARFGVAARPNAPKPCTYLYKNYAVGLCGFAILQVGDPLPPACALPAAHPRRPPDGPPGAQDGLPPGLLAPGTPYDETSVR